MSTYLWKLHDLRHENMRTSPNANSNSSRKSRIDLKPLVKSSVNIFEWFVIKAK